MMKKTKNKKDAVCRLPDCCPGEDMDMGHESHSINDISWRIFRIMSEFVDGFQFLSTSTKEVTVFGSARLAPDNKWSQEAEKFGALVAKGGFTMITGGGPGIMEAANKGSFEAGGESIGLNIQLPMEQRANPYLTGGKGFHYFFTRKVMLSASAQAYIFFPGGFGTLDEIFEMVVLIQTKKAQNIPIVLVGKEFWTPLLEWIKTSLVNEYETISKKDLDLLQLVDSAKEAWAIVKKSKERQLF